MQKISKTFIFSAMQWGDEEKFGLENYYENIFKKIQCLLRWKREFSEFARLKNGA